MPLKHPIPIGSPMRPDLRFALKRFEALSLQELYDVLYLRNVVFVVGQKITSEPEVDGLDPRCSHAMLYAGDELVGTARVFDEESPMVIGRVAVHTERQREGLGTILMERIQDELGDTACELHAQAHLEEWYSRLGWKRVGEVFDEAGIPHVMMVRGDVGTARNSC
ncbi:MAG: GNAT family N-acetyltransferase [Bradymonadaceae bacterium]